MVAPEIIVVGAGVSGLTTAVCLQESGRSVRIRTRDARPVTSCAAAAIWSPYGTEHDTRITGWSEITRTELSRIAVASGDGTTGVRLLYGLEAARSAIDPPAWATELDDYSPSTPDDLPDAYVSGWWYRTPVVDMPRYLAYLRERFLAAGGEIVMHSVDSFAEALTAAPVIVNCTGVAARELTTDNHLRPNRGQLVVVENPGLDEFFIQHEEGPETTYFIPHGDQVVLGGSSAHGNTNLAPESAVAAGIVARCAAIEPALGRATVLEHRVGLRPERQRVRLEREDRVVHNYGHGGNGVTLSWGCAREAAALAIEALAAD